MDGFIGVQQDFEFDAEVDRKPVELLQDRVMW